MIIKLELNREEAVMLVDILKEYQQYVIPEPDQRLILKYTINSIRRELRKKCESKS